MATGSSTINRITPKGVGADNKADIPSAYIIKYFDMINQNGGKIDIQNLVVNFSITEELHSPIVVLNIKIRDDINFFEDFKINGQEKIRLSIEHILNTNETKKIELEFDVKEYPNYQKSINEPNIQEYDIVAVSPFAYSSATQAISKSVKGNTVDNIIKIFNDKLGVDVKNNSICVSSFDGVITIQTPLKAIEWLRKKSFDINGSPFLIYSNISIREIQMTSLAELWSKNNKIIKYFYYRQFLSGSFNNSYHENATRILDMKSNLKLDKLDQINKGAFSGTTRVVDLSTKSFTDKVFDFAKDNTVFENSLSLKSMFNAIKNFKFNTRNSEAPKSLSDLSSASITNLAVNSSAFSTGQQNSTSILSENASHAKSFIANMETISHQIIVYGDLGLNPGKKINIRIPKAVNRTEYEKIHPHEYIELDKSFSGDYIISLCSHSFKEGVYTSKIKIIKDS